MLSNLFTRRAFAGHLATLFPGLGLAAALPASAVAKSKEGEVQKLNWEGKPTDPSSFITPLIIHNGVIYIAGQGAHSHDSGANFPMDIENHTKHVMQHVNHMVVTDGGPLY